MPRKARMIVEGESAVYHVMSRTALDGFVIGDAEKDYLLQLIKYLSSVYFTEIMSFCLMGNHFHLTRQEGQANNTCSWVVQKMKYAEY